MRAADRAGGPSGEHGTAGRSRPGRVIVVGSVNTDLVMRLPRLPLAGETVLGGLLSRSHGGKGANQAVAAARAGAPVHLIGAVGAQDGEDSVRALVAEGVSVAGVLRADAATGLAAVLVGEDGENQIAVASGANALVTAGHVGERLAGLRLDPADVVVLSFELPSEPLRAAARLAVAAGARLVVNPAPVQPGHADLLAGAIATPNSGELGELAELLVPARPAGQPAEAGPSAAASALARYTAAPVIVTMGPDGALLASPDGTTEQVPGHQVTVVDTTGAGDTLTGVLAASLAVGYPLRASLERAVAASALTVTGAGARSAMPTAAAIDDLLRSA